MGNDSETGEPITLNSWIDCLAPNALAVVAAGIKVSVEQAGEQMQLLQSLGETQEALEEG